MANLAMVPVSAQGYIQVAVNGLGRTGLFAGVAGYYLSGRSPDPSTDSFPAATCLAGVCVGK